MSLSQLEFKEVFEINEAPENNETPENNEAPENNETSELNKKVEINKAFEMNDERRIFQDILEQGKITTLYQPIFSLKTGEVYGYEALSRGPENTVMYSPIILIHRSSANNWQKSKSASKRKENPIL